jgi:hypothetical protein
VIISPKEVSIRSMYIGKTDTGMFLAKVATKSHSLRTLGFGIPIKEDMIQRYTVTLYLRNGALILCVKRLQHINLQRQHLFESQFASAA